MTQVQAEKASSSVVLTQQTALTLADSAPARAELKNTLVGFFNVQKVFGREPEALGAIVAVFNKVLAPYPADTVRKALALHMERSQEFPTPADIVGLIKRGGKPPYSQARYIAISKKDGADRTREEWDYMHGYERELGEGFGEPLTPEKDEALRADNVHLRQQVRAKNEEIAHLNAMLHEARMAKGLEKPTLTEEQRVLNTANAMRAQGASSEDISEFLQPYGMTYEGFIQNADEKC